MQEKRQPGETRGDISMRTFGILFIVIGIILIAVSALFLFPYIAGIPIIIVGIIMVFFGKSKKTGKDRN